MMVTNPSKQWPAFALTEVFEVRSGLSKPASEFGSGFPFVTFKDVLDNYFLPDTLGSLVRSTENERSLCSVRRGDVFLTRTSETQEDLGMSSVAMRDYEDATFNGFTKRLRPKDPQRIVPEYAAYFLRSPRFRADMSAFSSLSTRASLNNDMLDRLKIVLPDVGTQEEIGYTLRSLDDKIEQNRRTARALERLARAIFRAWFVDFEPVKAKATGATAFPSMPQAVFDALPTRFVDSAIGPVPEGWEVASLGDVAVQRRESVQPKDIDPETPYIGLEHMPRRSIALTEWGHAGKVTSGKARFRVSQILFGKLRPYFHKVGLAPIDGVCSTDIVVMEPKDSFWLGVVLGHLTSDEFVDHATAYSTGTKMPRTNWRDMASYKIAVPPESIAAALTVIVGPMLELLSAGIFESRTLARMRDYLLPKLLSGEVQVDRAADQAHGATG